MAVVRVMLHGEREVRTAALKAVPSDAPALSALLLKAFEAQLASLANTPHALVATALQSLARGLFASPVAVGDEARLLAQAQYFVLAHHPRVVLRPTHPLQGTVRALAHPTQVVAYLFGAHVLHGTPQTRAALAGAAATVVRALPNGAALLAGKTLAVLKEPEALQVSAEDMGILATPEGTPFGKPQLSDECVHVPLFVVELTQPARTDTCREYGRVAT